ncbi:F5/8 type C domain-containing protein [Belliella buryatensis]|uniref:F5/8 type C domain-containing protein n=1 Tax=Belliella buryatensis TaxID=1500549 RepID=A0A239CA99_9BACT|nr:DUF3472 domain-containing protein [Belliella buryatensis]SNS16822.1 F5/8 type C domain-containing protein [Belliella buryatensis]
MKQMIKLLILGLLSFIGCAEPETPLDNDQTSYAEAFIIPLGGNTYQIAGEENTEITQDGIRSWTSPATVFGVFFKSSGSPEVRLNIDIESQEGESEIEIKINDTSKKITLQNGKSGIVKVGDFKLEAGYTKIEIQGISKGGSNFSKIKAIKIEHNNDLSPSFVKDNQDNNFYWGRRGPSVHLGYQVPDGINYKWFYNEMTIPEGQDPIGSYFMANGFAEGYFGIQVNSPNERRVLFSVWSPFVTDNPNEIPEDERIIVLKKGQDVYTGEFGNEGSGGQSYLRFNWVAGNTYKFINSVEPDGNGNTIYTGYFFAPEVGEWQIIASFKRPKTNTWYKRPHSFLENFNPNYGHQGRKVHYDNQWIRSTSGNWTELTEARFTGDAIATLGFRMDYAGGFDNGKFYLQNCGFFDQNTTLNSMHSRSSNNQTPQIDFEFLETLGVAITTPEQVQEMDKSEWEIISFSSEETSGEGATGRAKDVIDGDVNTYWHSRWSSDVASYPHHFTVDMSESREVEGFLISQRNGSRKIKDFKIYVSQDNEDWTVLKEGNLQNNASKQNIVLTEKTTFRYFKFEGLNAHDGQQFGALAEIGVY